MGQRPKHLKAKDVFPKLNKKNHLVTSDTDPRYNCIAFAAGESHRKWWPIFQPGFYWPPGVVRSATIDSFVEAFRTLGYAPCSDGAFVEGVEKVALYAKDGAPKHAAIQDQSGKWKSKLGNSFDIEHAPDAVDSESYGKAVRYLSRPRA